MLCIRFRTKAFSPIILALLLSPSQHQQLAAETPVRIGIITPYSTDEHGEGHLKGAQAVFAEMKEEVSNTTGHPLELLVRDSTATGSETEPQRALSHARDLVENHHVIAILGAVNSGATIAIQGYIDQNFRFGTPTRTWCSLSSPEGNDFAS